MKRVEIGTGSSGADYASKYRPVFIVQDDQFNATASITVSWLTNGATYAPLFWPVNTLGPIDNRTRSSA